MRMLDCGLSPFGCSYITNAQSHLSVAQASFSCKCLGMQHATPVFITGALHLDTYVCTIVLNYYKSKSNGLQSNTLFLLGWFLWCL